MNVMVLDIELNQLNDNPKTIQIGAAAFKAAKGQLLGTFETYVDPEEPITEYISKEVTGIYDKDVQGAPKIKEAFLMLQEFHKKHRCFRNPIVWGSGVRNDSHTIWEEANIVDERGHRMANFMGYRVIDVKGMFQSIQIFHNKTIRGGLEETCKKLGIGFEGRAHTALADAMNTFRVWHFLTKQYPRGFDDLIR